MGFSGVEILGETLDYYGIDFSSASEIAVFAKEKQLEINRSFLKENVVILDPSNTYIGPRVEIGEGSVIYPNVYIFGETKIGKGCKILPFSFLNNVKMGNDNEIVSSHLCDTRIGERNLIGPYCRSRGGTVIGNDVKIGNFNELKNTDFGDESRMAHFSYLGDCTVGRDVNIGAATVTANYDGVNKHHSYIGDGAFVGSRTTLVSPIRIGEGAMTAAGSTITEDVPPKAMGIARARQINKEGYADAFHQKALKKGK